VQGENVGTEQGVVALSMQLYAFQERMTLRKYQIKETGQENVC